MILLNIKNKIFSYIIAKTYRKSITPHMIFSALHLFIFYNPRVKLRENEFIYIPLLYSPTKSQTRCKKPTPIR